MLKALLARQIDKIERRWGYDASYMRLILAASPRTFLRFGLLTQIIDRKAARMYPTLKYALGHGKACSKVTVAGVATPVAHLPQAA